MTTLQLEAGILSDVVTQFVTFARSTSRLSLLIKYEGLPAGQTIFNLIGRNFLRRKTSNVPTDEEEYLPMAAAFQFCGNAQLRDQAKTSTTLVLHALKQMFKSERKKEYYVFEDLERHLDQLYPTSLFETASLKLGLYLAKDLNVLGGYRLNAPDDTEVTGFQIGEAAISMADPEAEWDSAMARYMPASAAVLASDEKSVHHQEDEWERIKRLGGGGQSEVFLVRTPERTTERARCIEFLSSFPPPLTAAREERAKLHAQFAESLQTYMRPDLPEELGAMKVFKIREEGGEQQALDRLKQEMRVLQQNRPGLPKLLDFSETERWIVTEYFPRGTLEDNISRYRGKPALALKAFLSLVNTVLLLHEEDVVHRDIKPANVFVRRDDELVLGDFGIVYLPNQPKRLTHTNESVGPHDYMPSWGNVGGRLEHVHTNFDVYMLGKLLWCMVSGNLWLNREFFREPGTDVSILFRDDPHAYMINTILEKCLVDRAEKCVSITDLHAIVIAFVSLIEQGGQLLQEEVPRPCHVCGVGEYHPELFRQANSAFRMRFWNLSGGANDINLATVRVYACDRCGHMQFFKSST